MHDARFAVLVQEGAIAHDVGGAGFDAVDGGRGMGRAQEDRIGLSGQHPVVLEVAFALNQPHILQAPDGLADAEFHDASLPLIADLDGLSQPGAGQMILLENLRFWPEEEANDTGFAEKLAKYGAFYVNDAFSCAHRAHASTHALARHLPAFAGPVMAAELQALGAALDQPQRPVAAVVGGAKVSTKLAVLTHLIDKVDRLLLGGGMANTFLAAKGVDMGASLMEADLVDTAAEIIAAADKKGCQLFLPEDGLAATEFKAGAAHRQIPNSAILATEMMLDIGPNAISHYQQALAGVRTVLWNGPMGAFEIAPFDTATVALARAVAKATEAGELLSVAGGGDTVAALNHAGVTDKFSYVSLAGGAFLEYIEGKTLPGIAVLAK